MSMDLHFEVSMFGLNTPHDIDLIVDRPYGIEPYLLMCFSTPFFSRTINGIERGEAGDCILHDPSFAQCHGTIEGMEDGFRNYWIHLRGESIMLMAKRYSLPFNEIIRTGNGQLLAPLMQSVEAETHYRKPLWEEKVRLLVEDMFLTISRCHEMNTEWETLSVVEQEFKSKFIELRASIHQQFEKPWTVEQMAALVRLSPGRFWVLYQKLFKASPKDDLIHKRLEEAKARLFNSNRSIEQISQECGFNSLFYFSRIFKKRTGYTPSEFRRNMGHMG